ncbi:MAG: methylglyoxal/glyoxal reductase [Fusobacteriaceae bacterium]|jgi:diketogulonate reductase-like aldo/keto reductase|nr:methylglyoxal/glyoxal reductase [Fusobacteriaceae bacterium]
MNKNLLETITLNNGVKIPKIGFGTFKVENGNDTINSVKKALEVGYRHIDTAAIYGNEEGVGIAIKESGVPREEIFLVSKVWNSEQGYDTTIKAFEESLKRLQTDYLDMYLIHWAKPKNRETWKALETLYKEGKIKAIGVSNFEIHHLEDLLEVAEIIPVVNQVELHPQFPQEELREYCKKHNIAIEAWGPLMQGKIFEIPLMKELSIKYNKSIAQIALRWHYQQDIITIPKSIKPERIESNIDIFDFAISAEDMEKIKTLKGERIGLAPDMVYNSKDI